MSLDDQISFLPCSDKLPTSRAAFPRELSVIEKARKEISRVETSVRTAIHESIGNFNEGLISSYELGAHIVDVTREIPIHGATISALWEAQQNYMTLLDHGGISPEMFNAAIQAAFDAGKASK